MIAATCRRKRRQQERFPCHGAYSALRAAGTSAGLLASLSGNWWLVIFIYVAIAVMGVLLATHTGTPADKLTDAGRGLVVGVILALLASAIAHRDDV
jgi:hypothetical protein